MHYNFPARKKAKDTQNFAHLTTILFKKRRFSLHLASLFDNENSPQNTFRQKTSLVVAYIELKRDFTKVKSNG